MINKLILLVSLLALMSCHSSNKLSGSSSGSKMSLTSAYRNAIMDAMYPDSSKIDYHLLSFSGSDTGSFTWKMIDNQRYVKVVSWKYSSYTDSTNPFKNPKWLWVTVVPELQKRMKRDHICDTLRMRQLLGLPPTGYYRYFVTFWVRPQDLMRPCPDTSIHDSSCMVCMTASTSGPDYYNSFNNKRIESYYSCGLFNQYPWTQLGYTYDWNPDVKSHHGLSEFVVKENSTIYKDTAITTTAYFQMMCPH